MMNEIRSSASRVGKTPDNSLFSFVFFFAWYTNIFCHFSLLLDNSGRFWAINWNVLCSFITFFHNKDIVYHLISLLLDSGKIQFTGTTFATILLVDMLVIKHGCCIDWYEWEPSTVHQLVFLHNKVIFWYFCSALVNSGPFQLTSTVSSTALLVELMAIKHGHHIASCLHW